jgi:hypothetical protein
MVVRDSMGEELRFGRRAASSKDEVVGDEGEEKVTGLRDRLEKLDL